MSTFATFLLIFLVGAWALYTHVRSLQTGVIKYRISTYERKGSPFWYWFYTAAAGLIGVVLVVAGAYFLFVRLP